MAGARGLGYCLDESMGRRLAATLRDLRAPGAPAIHDIRDLELGGTKDETWLPMLHGKGVHAMVTRDSSVLAASVRRGVWQASGITLFVLDGKWGNLRLFEQARRLIWWWPIIVQQAEEGPQGGAWRLPPDFQASGMQRIFASVEAELPSFGNVDTVAAAESALTVRRGHSRPVKGTGPG